MNNPGNEHLDHPNLLLRTLGSLLVDRVGRLQHETASGGNVHAGLGDHGLRAAKFGLDFAERTTVGFGGFDEHAVEDAFGAAKRALIGGEELKWSVI